MIVKAISFTNSEENRDSFAILDDGIVVCDGVSSVKFAGETAKFFTSYFAEFYKDRRSDPLREKNPDIVEIVSRIFCKLGEEIEGDALEWQTTFISVLRTGLSSSGEELYQIAWLGNGAVFVFKSSYMRMRFKPLVNLVIPDVDSGGRLTRTFNPAIFYRPSVIEISSPEPLLFIVCTDGVHSAEMFEIIRDSEDESGSKFYQDRPEIIDFILERIIACLLYTSDAADE